MAIRDSDAVRTEPSGALTRLSGWGANLRVDCLLREPSTQREVATDLDRRGTIARGLGRSYGDPAINAGGQVLGMTRLDRYLSFDEQTGVLVCEAGVSLEQIIHTFAPQGWFPMITPGTKLVTVGGCIANDIHGKAHHVQGSFSNCVEAMTVLLASGEVVVASRSQNPDLFLAASAAWACWASCSRPPFGCDASKPRTSGKSRWGAGSQRAVGRARTARLPVPVLGLTLDVFARAGVWAEA